MLISFFTKIYMAMSGFKNNVLQLSGNPDILEDEAVAGTRIDMDEFPDLLHDISSIFEKGLSEQEIRIAQHTIEGLSINGTTKFHYIVRLNTEVLGMTIIAVRDRPTSAILCFVTEEKVAYHIQGVISVFHLPENQVLQ